jgi:hypothetical protein
MTKYWFGFLSKSAQKNPANHEDLSGFCCFSVKKSNFQKLKVEKIQKFIPIRFLRLKKAQEIPNRPKDIWKYRHMGKSRYVDGSPDFWAGGATFLGSAQNPPLPFW